MDKTNATEASAPAIAPKEIEVDLEARYAALEAEKAKLIEEGANYKLAYLKEAKRNKGNEIPEGDDDERIRRIANEALANSQLAEIARQQDAMLKNALKENKELKLAQLNKTSGVPSAIGSHTEGKAVSDTLVTPEQLVAFKARGWSEKDIERYKKNLLKNTR